MRTLLRVPVGLAAVAILTLSSPAAALPIIPQYEIFASEGRREVLHIRIHEGCDAAATDRVEIEVPEGVVAVIPEEVPGWTATTETGETDPYEIFGERRTDRIERVIWTGGPLDADRYQDFGIFAVFTEPTDGLVVPVVQGCGTDERVWDEVIEEGQSREDVTFPAPTVRVVEVPFTDVPGLEVDQRALRTDVDALRSDLDDLRTEFDDLRLGEIGGSRLRDRIDELERRLAQFEEQLDELIGRS